MKAFKVPVDRRLLRDRRVRKASYMGPDRRRGERRETFTHAFIWASGR